MFSFSKDKSKPQVAEEQVTQFQPVDVYTPPARFLPSVNTNKSSSKGNVITIILIILFLLVVAGGIGVWLFFSKNNNSVQNLEQPEIAPLDIATDSATEQNQPSNTDSTVTVPPQPITYVAKDEAGNVNGILTLQLSASDKQLVDQVVITNNNPSNTKQYIVGSSYTISPRGKELTKDAKLTIEYFDTTLSSNVENSLRIAFLSSTGEWQLDDKTEIDLSRNKVSIDIVQLPSTQVAVVSNLTMDEISKPDDNSIDVDQDFEVKSLTPSFDTDADELSDVEELLFKTDINRPDSDLDGYTDGEEVLNLFSPSQPGKTLLDTTEFSLYTSPVFGYTLQYPSVWTVNNVEDDSNIVIFNSATNQFVEVIIEKLDSSFKTIQDWYQSQVPGLAKEDIRTTSVGKNNYFAILSVDGTTTYFVVDNFVVGITYNKGIETEADYLTIYNAMKNSWSWSVDSTDDLKNNASSTEQVLPDMQNSEQENL